MKRYFCTYLDQLYAARGLAMLRSLLSWCPEAHLYILALDEMTEQILRQELGNCVRVVTPGALATYEPRLLEARSARTPWEFYATQKPIFLKWALDQTPDGEVLAYVDADTFFYASPEPAWEALGCASIGLSPHRFNPTTAHLSLYGTYNAGFGLWRKDPVGSQSLHDWSTLCLGWCHEQPQPDGRFMNQGYLNDWPTRYSPLQVLTHPGLNLAPWNVGSHTLVDSAGAVFVDAKPLIFFHFSSVHRQQNGTWWTFDMDPALRQPVVMNAIYGRYLGAVLETSQHLKTRYGIDGVGSVREPPPHIPALLLSQPPGIDQGLAKTSQKGPGDEHR